MRKGPLNGKEGTLEIGIRYLVEQRLVHLFHRDGLRDTCVDHKNIDLPEVLNRLFIKSVEIGEIRYITPNSKRPNSNGVDRFIQCLLVTPEYYHLGTLGLELLSGGQPDAAVTACDNCYFAFELHD
jgi:hypothetical protein